MEATRSVSRTDVPTVPWWLVLLEGIAAILLGVMFLISPREITVLLIQIVGWYWLISGIFSIVSLFTDRRQWGWKLFSGIIGIIAGFVIIQNPVWSTIMVPAAFLVALAIGGLIIGVIKIIQAFSGAGLGAGILGGISIVLALLILAQPFLGVSLFFLLFPIFALIGGIVAVIAAFQLRGVEQGYAPAAYSSTTTSSVPVTGPAPEDIEHHEPGEPPDQLDQPDQTDMNR